MTAEIRGFASMIPISDPANVPFGRQKALLYGPPKEGKTTFASGYEDPLFLDGEAGTLNMAVPTFEALIGRDRVDSPIRTWEDVLKATSVLEGIKDAKGTVIVDPVNEIFQWCREYVLRTNGWDHETDGAYGKGWRAVRDEFSGWVGRLVGLPYGLVFIAHVNSVEVESATEKYEKVVPRMDKACKEIIEPMVDIIMYMHTRTFPEHKIYTPTQVIQTKPTREVTAGERGNKPRLPLFVSPATYEEMNSKWIEANAKAAEEATPND